MPTTLTHKKWKYDPHPSIRLAQSVIAGMKEKTGRSIEGWIRLTKKEGPSGEKERAAWLKKTYGLGTNYASWIAGRSTGKSDAFEDADQYLRHAEDYVDGMYAGPKEHLRVIYDEILTYAKTLGCDIGVSPCQTIVPIYRNHVICPNQADDPHSHRFGTGVARHQDAESPDRYRRVRQERPHYPPHRDQLDGRLRRRSKTLAASGLRHG
jgi:hypothetical protein